MLKIKQFVFNNFDENTYLAVDDATRKAALIDPGMLMESERKTIADFIEKNDLHLEQVILTHAHLDHCFGVGFVKDKYGVPVKGHEADAPLARIVHLQGQRFGMGYVIKKPVEFDVNLKDGDTITIGESSLDVIHVPGHSPGGIVLFDSHDRVAFVGDSIFRGSIGRTDLEGGNYATLINALKKKILSLPENTVLLSGHGDPTTVGDEIKYNPFLK